MKTVFLIVGFVMGTNSYAAPCESQSTVPLDNIDLEIAGKSEFANQLKDFFSNIVLTKGDHTFFYENIKSSTGKFAIDQDSRFNDICYTTTISYKTTGGALLTWKCNYGVLINEIDGEIILGRTSPDFACKELF